MAKRSIPRKSAESIVKPDGHKANHLLCEASYKALIEILPQKIFIKGIN